MSSVQDWKGNVSTLAGKSFHSDTLFNWYSCNKTHSSFVGTLPKKNSILPGFNNLIVVFIFIQGTTDNLCTSKLKTWNL